MSRARHAATDPDGTTACSVESRLDSRPRRPPCRPVLLARAVGRPPAYVPEQGQQAPPPRLLYPCFHDYRNLILLSTRSWSRDGDTRTAPLPFGVPSHVRRLRRKWPL